MRPPPVSTNSTSVEEFQLTKSQVSGCTNCGSTRPLEKRVSIETQKKFVMCPDCGLIKGVAPIEVKRRE